MKKGFPFLAFLKMQQSGLSSSRSVTPGRGAGLLLGGGQAEVEGPSVASD